MAEEGLIKFLKLCQRAKTIEELKSLFDLFLTFEEKELLASRYAIIQELLKEELSQREIAKKHHVSIAQITRGSNALKIITPTMRNFLKEHV